MTNSCRVTALAADRRDLESAEDISSSAAPAPDAPLDLSVAFAPVVAG